LENYQRFSLDLWKKYSIQESEEWRGYEYSNYSEECGCSWFEFIFEDVIFILPVYKKEISLFNSKLLEDDIISIINKLVNTQIINHLASMNYPIPNFIYNHHHGEKSLIGFLIENVYKNQSFESYLEEKLNLIISFII